MSQKCEGFIFNFVFYSVFSPQAMLDVAANEGWLVTALSICNLVQMIVQGRWLHDSSLQTLPHVEQQDLYLFRSASFNHS